MQDCPLHVAKKCFPELKNMGYNISSNLMHDILAVFGSSPGRIQGGPGGPGPRPPKMRPQHQNSTKIEAPEWQF